jgi:hypothetical protein
MIANLDLSVPLISDADTGYGGKIYFQVFASSAVELLVPKISVSFR